MLELIVYILTQHSLGRYVAKNIVLISYTVLGVKSLFISGAKGVISDGV
ncbi:MAG: hypothetical protein N2380_04085 [bacterium]|nr:hypothetical protein [bacterium]